MGVVFLYVKIKMAVGEYVGGHDCRLPKPVSIYREYSQLRLRIGWCMRLSKMKILGSGYQGIVMPNEIQSREYSRDGDTDDILHESPRSTSTTIAT